MDGEGGVEGGAGFQHGTGDIEEAVGDRSQRAAMTVPAAPESGVFGPALGVMLDGNAGPMVHGVAKPVMASLSPDDNTAFAGPLGDRRDSCQKVASQFVLESVWQISDEMRLPDQAARSMI